MSIKNVILLLVSQAMLASCTQSTAVNPSTSLVDNFTQTTPAGTSIVLSDYKGKVVMIEFWATWCSPCKAHMPIVKSFWSARQSKNFQLIGVSLDYDLDSWRTYIQANSLDWVHCTDGNYWDNAVAKQFDVRYTPAFLVFDEFGKRIGGVTGFTEAAARVDSILN